MLDIFDRLFFEVIKVQMLHSTKNQNTIYLDSCFMRKDTEIIENLLEDYDVEELKEEETLSLDEVLELLVADLEVFPLLYQLPKVTIQNDEWDFFFQTLFSYYQQLKSVHFFLEDMESLNRYAISKAMIDQEDINLSTYINSLIYLDSEVIYPSNIRQLKDILQKEFPINISKPIKMRNYKKSRKDIKKVTEDIKESDFFGEEIIIQKLRMLGYQVEEVRKPVSNEKSAIIYQLDPKRKSFIKKNEI